MKKSYATPSFLFEFTLQINPLPQSSRNLCHSRVGTFEVCVPTHVALRVIMQVLAR